MTFTYHSSHGSHSDPWGIILTAGGMGVVLLWKAFQSLKLKKMAEALATSKARSIAVGMAELEGNVQSLGTLVDPIYSKPCGCYKITVKEWRQQGKSGSWVTIHEEASTQPFSLLDPTGAILVLPLKVEWEENLTLDAQTGLFSSTKNDPALNSYLGQFKKTFRSLKLEAYILREGDPLYVIGFAQPIDSRQPQHASISLQEAARLLKSDKARFAQLDTNHDGQVDDQEWEKGLNDFKDELERKAQGGKSVPGVMKNIGLMPGPNRPLVFSRSQKELISKTNNQFVLWTLAGSSLILLATFLLLNQIK